MLEGLFRNLIVSPIFLIFISILFFYVMTRNYARFRKDTLKIDLLENEKVVDQIDVDLWIVRGPTFLTNQRVVQLISNWFLSRRKTKSIALQDIHSLNWLRCTNWLFFVAGLFFLGLINPLALVLFLLGLEGKVYLLRFNTPFAQMPLTRIAVRTLRRGQLSRMWSFYRNAQIAWAKTRIQSGLSATVNPPAETIHENDFAWGRPVWSYLAFFFACGLIQRILEAHISFDDFIFFPLYLGLPVAIAQRNLRDALWTAILGFAALFTIKFPCGGLLSLFVSDGGAPFYEQYFFVALTLVMMVLLAYGISRYVYRDLSFLAVALWLGFLALYMPGILYDFGLYAIILIAMAVAILLAQFERAAGSSYRAISTN